MFFSALATSNNSAFRIRIQTTKTRLYNSFSVSNNSNRSKIPAPTAYLLSVFEPLSHSPNGPQSLAALWVLKANNC